MVEDLVTIKRSKKAKRVALRLDPVERIINLIIPEKMSLRTAYSFAYAHQEWINSTLETLPKPIPFDHGREIPIFGKKLYLDININKDLKRTTIKQYDNVLKIKTYQDDPTNRIRSYIKKLAKSGLTNIASDKAELIDRHILSIRIGDTKSRWGSCSQDGKISFSWRLIFAPYDAIDYVVAHEVAHMRYMNHSKEFWQLCKEISCNYDNGKNWMKRHSNTLMSYGQRDIP